jgi:hypothetical protein
MREVYAITCQLKSGATFAWSGKDGTFALVPLRNGVFIGAFFWDSHDAAEGRLLDQMKLAPSLSKLGPFKIEQMWGQK